MSTHKHRKLKRHPIVRFIRGIFRLFRVLFRPNRTIARLDLPRPDPITEPIFDYSFESGFNEDRLITVGEVLDGIKWQSPPPKIQNEFASNSRISKPQDVSRN
jgi:hypothetical protein